MLSLTNHAALNGGNREIYRANYVNAVLFFPSGLLGFEMLPKCWSEGWKWLLTTVLLALFSACIEYAQYRHGLGLAEVDDVIHNTLGALLGATVQLHKS